MEFVDLIPERVLQTQTLEFVLGLISHCEMDSFLLTDPPKVVDPGLVPTFELDTFEFKDHSEEEDPDAICVKDCSGGPAVTCPDPSGNFKVKNFLSELKTEYERLLARLNLGIADEYTLKWENITGNLLNATDLVTFVRNAIEGSSNSMTTYIQNILEDHTIIMKNYINDQILNGGGIGARLGILLTPSYMLYGSDPVDVVASWNIVGEVSSLKVNGTEVDPSTRTYLFPNVSSSFTVLVDYVTEASHSMVAEFKLVYPIFYGSSSDYKLCTPTGENTFTINSSEYIYIISPYTDTELAVNGFTGGFIKLNTPVFIYDHEYTIYKSTNTKLGETKITITHE